ncbi:MAG: hypothetical protein Q8M86_08290, partial [Syntrophales bacterium]|nr:hypothetical protein [Syntrophales bacterium]
FHGMQCILGEKRRHATEQSLWHSCRLENTLFKNPITFFHEFRVFQIRHHLRIAEFGTEQAYAAKRRK